MSHKHCCHDDHSEHGNFLLPLAALIGLVLLAFRRRRGIEFAVIMILAVLIVCGCGRKFEC